ncbi:MAG: ACP S-malonyltransferase [Lentisphaerae bacterium]|nr:ACP S-malonyltransferase [Lentisphaerota bacterium]
MNNAYVFAGQGAQSVGMGRDLAEAYPECKELFAKADEVLGRSLSKVCFEGPIEELTRSNNCQPAIFVTSIACLHAMRLSGAKADPVGVAGLSLGEWTALHAAGAIGFEDAVRVLEARGRFMQEACEQRQGGMVSVIGLGTDQLRKICEMTGLEIANMNSAEQTVLSGDKAAIADAERLAKEAGAKKTIVLNVAGAFHSSLMAPAAVKLEAELARVNILAPGMPVVANVTGEPHGGPDSIRRDMVRQVTGSVRWVSCVEWFKAHGVSCYVEFGPGKVLAGLIKRIDGAAALHNVQDAASAAKAAEVLKVQ